MQENPSFPAGPITIQGFSDSETNDGLRMLNASGTKMAFSKGYFCFDGFSVYTLIK
jgi:hypothetical protein